MTNISKAKALLIAAKEASDKRKAAVANAAKRIDVKQTAKLADTIYQGASSAHDVALSVKGFIGNSKPDTPVYDARYNTARLTNRIARVAFGLKVAGKNGTPDALMAEARNIDAACSPTAEKMPKGCTRRRSEIEHKLVRAADQAWSALCKAHDIATPNSNGGTARGESKPNAAPKKSPLELAKAEATKAKAEATRITNKFGPPKAADKESAITYLERQAVAMAAYIDKVQASTKASIPPAYVSAAQDFLAAIKAAK